MTLISEILTQAYREGNLIAVGTSETAAEQTEALARLNSLYSSWIDQALGELVFDWLIPPNTNTAPLIEENPRDPYAPNIATPFTIQPPANSRIVSQITEETTVYFPQFPSNGARMAVSDAGSTAAINLILNGNGRKIESAVSVTIVPATVGFRQWMYRADTANWVRMADFVAGDSSPLPSPDFDDLLICGLSIRLAPRTGTDPHDVTVATFQRMLRKLKTTYKQAVFTPASQRIQGVQSVGYDDLGSPGGYGQFLAGQ